MFVMMDTSDTGSAFQPKKGDIDMKTGERLLFMALGGLLVLVGMIVGQFVLSPVQAQAGAQDATFKRVKCQSLEVYGNEGVAIMEVSDNGYGGSLVIYNEFASPKLRLEVNEFDGGEILGKSSKGDRFFNLSSKERSGELHLRQQEGGEYSKPLFSATRQAVKCHALMVSDVLSENGGSIFIYNAHGVRVAVIQANKNKDGVIALYDRYGDLGWAQTGKR